MTPLDIERTTGPDRGQHLPGRALARAALLQPAGARLGPLQDPGQATCGCAARPPTRVAGSWAPTAASRRWSCSAPRAADGHDRAATEPRWDAVVIGAGHNALVTAAYLAKGGLRTLVLERRDRVGGAADTTELAKGILVPTLAHTVGRLRPSVQKDLAFPASGCRSSRRTCGSSRRRPTGAASRSRRRREDLGRVPLNARSGARRGGLPRIRQARAPARALPQLVGRRPRPTSNHRGSRDADRRPASRGDSMLGGVARPSLIEEPAELAHALVEPGYASASAPDRRLSEPAAVFSRRLERDRGPVGRRREDPDIRRDEGQPG